MTEKKRLGMPYAAFTLAAYLLVGLVLTLIDCIESERYSELFQLLSIGITPLIILCGVLFARRRDTLLLGVLGVPILVSLASCATVLEQYFYRSEYYYSSQWNVQYTYQFIVLAAWIMLFLLALVLCEPTYIKRDLTKVRSIVGIFFFIPAVLFGVACWLKWDYLGSVMDAAGVKQWVKAMQITLDILMVATLLFLGKWLAFPKMKTEMMPRELKMYRKLLRMGAITQAEYEAKEQLILGNCCAVEEETEEIAEEITEQTEENT